MMKRYASHGSGGVSGGLRCWRQRDGPVRRSAPILWARCFRQPRVVPWRQPRKRRMPLYAGNRVITVSGGSGVRLAYA